MRSICKGACFFLLCLIVSTKAIHTLTPDLPSVQQPAALALLQQCFNAMGAPDESFGVAATGTNADSDHPTLSGRSVTFIAFGRHRLRREEDFGDSQSLLTIDGAHAKRRYRTQTQGLSPSEAIFRSPELLSAYNCKPTESRLRENITYVGRETHGGSLVDHIHFILPGEKTAKNKHWMNASEFDVFLDSQTHVLFALRRETFAADAMENHHTLEVRFGNFETVDGVLVPRRIEHFIGDQSIDVTTLASVHHLDTPNNSDFRQ
jgi:hypothetical protein